jgi:hypothetical protein
MDVRHYTRADEPEVRRIFRHTLSLGRPLPFTLSRMHAYERLCLGWFLDRGAEDVGVLDDDGQVRGYVLVCTDLRSYYRWAARATLSWIVLTVVHLLAGRLRGDTGRFHRLRLRDGWLALRHAPPAPMPALVHLNLDRQARAGLSGLALARFADERCRAAGSPGWFGEINAREGDRIAALAVIGLRTVHRQSNRTLSWLLDEPVERLTVVRSLDHDLGRDRPSMRPPISPGVVASEPEAPDAAAGT